MKYIFLFFALTGGLVVSSHSAEAACNVCHSKNPKMVRMHAALDYKNCFKCHGPASERANAGTQNEKRVTPMCTACHGK